jgi:hypothetical protein
VVGNLTEVFPQMRVPGLAEALRILASSENVTELDLSGQFVCEYIFLAGFSYVMRRCRVAVSSMYKYVCIALCVWRVVCV